MFPDLPVETAPFPLGGTIRDFTVIGTRALVSVGSQVISEVINALR